ncbi:MAG: KilA-N domain-containing protein [Pseudomonas sp.]
MSIIEVCGVSVRRDAEGRYSLNDLHKAAIANGNATDSQKPTKFLRTDGVKAFVEVLDLEGQNCPSIKTVKGRGITGTFAVELVAIRYAAWINPAFEVSVYRTFQAVHHQAAKFTREDARREIMREKARLECSAMTEALREQREEQGKATAMHHYANEMDLISRVVLGMTAKKYRDLRGIPDDALLRDYLSASEITAIGALQNANAAFILVGMTYDQRKEKLTDIFNRRHAKRIEADAVALLG